MNENKSVAVIGAGIAASVDVLNPAVQTRQYKAISNEVLNDKDVNVKNINKFITVLETVLSKI
jgi:hypothetical protein